MSQKYEKLNCRSSMAWLNCKDRLIILDEIQQLPGLFPVLRALKKAWAMS